MYKRRKKVTPVASSTLVSNSRSNAGSFDSSQSSIISTLDNRSKSPDDIFTQSPPKSSTIPSSISLDPQPSTSYAKRKSPSRENGKNTTAEILQMLMSSDDSEPLPKVAKTNGTSPVKRILSQSITAGPLKYFHEMLANSGLLIGRNGEPNTLSKY